MQVLEKRAGDEMRVDVDVSVRGSHDRVAPSVETARTAAQMSLGLIGSEWIGVAPM
jgi:hypothetical protein